MPLHTWLWFLPHCPGALASNPVMGVVKDLGRNLGASGPQDPLSMVKIQLKLEKQGKYLGQAGAGDRNPPQTEKVTLWTQGRKIQLFPALLGPGMAQTSSPSCVHCTRPPSFLTHRKRELIWPRGSSESPFGFSSQNLVVGGEREYQSRITQVTLGSRGSPG